MAQLDDSGAIERVGSGKLGTLAGAVDLAILVLIAVAGIGISIYLTTVHYAKVPLLCNTTGIINCTAVTTSAYAVVPGTDIPITVPGIVWFAALGVLALLAWRKQVQHDPALLRLTLVQLAWCALGLIGVLYLVYAEIVKLRAICEWCTAVHVLTLISFLIVLFRLQRLVLPDEE